MNARTVLVLAVGLVLLVAILQLTRWNSGSGENLHSELLFEGLREDMSGVGRVTVTAPGNAVVANLTRAEGYWAIAERNGYPANAGQLGQLLLALADARIVEAKTANAVYYSRLGVGDIAKPDAGGVLVEIQAGANQYAVIIGDEVQGEYRYVRRPDEAGSWLVDRSPEAPSGTTNWLDPALLDINAALIHTVRIQHPDGETVDLAKSSPEDSDFTVLQIPPGQELRYAGIANAIGGVLDNLVLEDVVTNATDMEEPVRTTFKTFDGRVVEINAEQVDGEPWIQVTTSYDAELAAKFAPPAGGAAEEEGPPVAVLAADGPSAEEVQSEVTALSVRVAGNRYQIASFKYEQLTRHWSDLLKE